MRIQSKFKDYYDFVGKKYGEDPDIVYSRGTVDPKLADLREGSGRWRSSNSFVSHYLQDREYPEGRRTYQMELVVAGDMIFPIVKVYQKSADIIEEMVTTTISYQHLDEDLLVWMMNRYNRYYTGEREWVQFHDWLNRFRPQLIKAQRAMRAPVFLVTRDGVHERVPVLSKCGIAALVSPEQMWQNIYTCLTNLRKNPDKELPVQISNKDRIVKAGFDLKTSFRNPINPRPKKGR